MNRARAKAIRQGLGDLTRKLDRLKAERDKIWERIDAATTIETKIPCADRMRVMCHAARPLPALPGRNR